MSIAYVEVNEVAVTATTLGATWWQLFRKRYDGTDRITEHGFATPFGSICHVACDDKADAEALAEVFISRGLPKSAVKVRAPRNAVPSAPAHTSQGETR